MYDEKLGVVKQDDGREAERREKVGREGSNTKCFGACILLVPVQFCNVCKAYASERVTLLLGDTNTY